VLGEYSRARDSARALVRTPWARRAVPRLVRALLERGTLSGEEIAVPTRPAALRLGDSHRCTY
jgi:hypothetical protein